MPKFRDYFRQMLSENEQVFLEFADIHEKYANDKAKYQSEFNRIGAPIQELLVEWEKKLCGHSEKGVYAKYSSKLAEKFRAEAKAYFPLVDFIGLKVVAQPKTPPTKYLLNNSPKAEPKKVRDLEEIDNLDDDFDIPKLF